MDADFVKRKLEQAQERLENAIENATPAYGESFAGAEPIRDLCIAVADLLEVVKALADERE